MKKQKFAYVLIVLLMGIFMMCNTAKPPHYFVDRNIVELYLIDHVKPLGLQDNQIKDLRTKIRTIPYINEADYVKKTGLYDNTSLLTLVVGALLLGYFVGTFTSVKNICWSGGNAPINIYEQQTKV